MKLSKIGLNEIKNYKLSDNKFVFRDSLLYKMVKNNFDNKDLDVIVAKLSIIGRTYAAALERVRETGKIVNYYDVARGMKSHKIDNDISKFKRRKNIDEETISEMCALHYKLTKLFENYANVDKRSLASKYLHFHLPDLVFIYDTRVKRSIGAFIDGKCILKKYPKINKKIINSKIDKDYAVYCLKAFEIYKEIKDIKKFKKGAESIPRYVDRLLIRYDEKVRP